MERNNEHKNSNSFCSKTYKDDEKRKNFIQWIFNIIFTAFCIAFIIRDYLRDNEIEILKNRLNILDKDIVILQQKKSDDLEYSFGSVSVDENSIDTTNFKRLKIVKRSINNENEDNREKRSSKSNRKNGKNKDKNRRRGRRNKNKKNKGRRNNKKKGDKEDRIEITEEEKIQNNQNRTESADKIIVQRGRKKPKNKRKKDKSSKSSDTTNTQVMSMQIDPKRSEPNSPDLKTGQEGSVIPYWKLADSDFNHIQDFGQYHHNGTVTIKKTGIYFLYSQMTYYDRSGRWSHLIDVSNKPIAKCLASEWGVTVDPETDLYYNTVHQCYTGTTTSITSGSLVSIKSMYSDRVIHADSEMSYWGIIKLQ